MKKPSSSRRKDNPLLVMGRVVSNVLPFLIILAAGAGFYLLMTRKEQVHSIKGDASIAFGLLLAIGAALCLNPAVQEKFQAWGRMRRAAQEDKFWKGRDINDARQAEAQAQAEAERNRRIAAREARLTALAEAEAKAASENAAVETQQKPV